MKPLTILTLFFLLVSQAISQNLYTSPNAASTNNEQNTITGWTGPAEIESKDDDPHHGQYAIRIKSEDGGTYGQYSFAAVPGTSYTITIWARRGQSSNSEFDEWQGFSDFQKRNITGQGWKEYVFNVTASSSQPVIKVFATKNGSDNRQVFVDAITIYAQQQPDNEPPTAPAGLSASGVTSSSLTLTWLPSTDNIGVAGYRIFRNNNNIGQVSGLTYQASGLLASTEYSFYVKAYDAEGNTSQASNTIVVTTPADGGSGGGSGGSGGSGGGSGTGGPEVYNVENANLPTVNWQALNFYSAGNVGIGTMPVSQFRLSVNGNIRTKELIVESGWSDFVFEPDYKLPSLSEVEKHIMQHGHLKDIPSAKEVEENGVSVGEINKLLLQKIEELTLYMITADKQISEAKKRVSELEAEIEKLKK